MRREIRIQMVDLIIRTENGNKSFSFPVDTVKSESGKLHFTAGANTQDFTVLWPVPESEVIWLSRRDEVSFEEVPDPVPVPKEEVPTETESNDESEDRSGSQLSFSQVVSDPSFQGADNV